MKQLVCEMCGGTDLVKQDGVFVCQSCGCKYSVEEARKMMIEGTVDVSGSTVKVDNSGLIDSYLKMAENALNSSNNEEAENYANKIIEINPKHSRAWFIKGKASGWQTTGRNNRYPESIINWINSYEFASEDIRELLSSEIQSEAINIGVAIIQMHCNNFINYRSANNKKDIDNSLLMIQKQMTELKTKTQIDAYTDNCKTLIAKILNLAAVNASNNANKDFGPDNSNKSKYAWDNYTNAQDYCLSLLDKAYGLSLDDDLKFTIANNYIIIAIEVRDSCSYKYDSNGYTSGYYKDYSFTESAKKSRTSTIHNWEKKRDSVDPEQRKKNLNDVINNCSSQLSALEYKTGFNKYWSEHTTERIALESERQQNTYQIQKLLAMKSAIPQKETKKKLQDDINKLKGQQADLNIFKSKEKKALQDQINLIQKDLDGINSQISDSENRIDLQIEPLKKRNEVISAELTMPRDKASITHIPTPLSFNEKKTGITFTPIEFVHYLVQYLPKPYSVKADNETAIINNSKVIHNLINETSALLASLTGQNNSNTQKPYVDDPLKEKNYKIVFTKNNIETKASVLGNAKSINEQFTSNMCFSLESDFSVDDATTLTIVASYLLFNLLPSSDLNQLQRKIAESIYGFSNQDDYICDDVRIRFLRSNGVTISIEAV